MHVARDSHKPRICAREQNFISERSGSCSGQPSNGADLDAHAIARPAGVPARRDSLITRHTGKTLESARPSSDRQGIFAMGEPRPPEFGMAHLLSPGARCLAASFASRPVLTKSWGGSPCASVIAAAPGRQIGKVPGKSADLQSREMNRRRIRPRACVVIAARSTHVVCASV